MARPVPLIATLGKCMKEMERHAQGGQSMLDQAATLRAMSKPGQVILCLPPYPHLMQA